jgi:hypothetical protein
MKRLILPVISAYRRPSFTIWEVKLQQAGIPTLHKYTIKTNECNEKKKKLPPFLILKKCN